MSEVLEDGDIYFLHRPRAGEEHVESLREVRRLLVVLHPWRGRDRLRLLVVGRRRLPEVDEYDRFWAFVEAVVSRPEELYDALRPHLYGTETRGEPSARPAAEGAYCITRHDDHTHLAYQLESPRRPGPPEQELEIEPEGSYVVSVKNPQAPSPPGMSVPGPGRPKLPADLQELFRTRRFAPVDPPRLLDHRGVQLVLIGAAHDASAQLGIDLDAEVERAARHTMFDDLRIGRAERPSAPLLTDRWQ